MGSKTNQGCNGGLMDYAFEYIKTNGIELESDYKYKGVDGTCAFESSKVATKLTSYTDVPQKNCAALQTAAAKQPISIAVDAAGLTWQFYFGGIVKGLLCGHSLDH